MANLNVFPSPINKSNAELDSILSDFKKKATVGNFGTEFAESLSPYNVSPPPLPWATPIVYGSKKLTLNGEPTLTSFNAVQILISDFIFLPVVTVAQDVEQPDTQIPYKWRVSRRNIETEVVEQVTCKWVWGGDLDQKPAYFLTEEADTLDPTWILTTMTMVLSPGYNVLFYYHDSTFYFVLCPYFPSLFTPADYTNIVTLQQWFVTEYTQRVFSVNQS